MNISHQLFISVSCQRSGSPSIGKWFALMTSSSDQWKFASSICLDQIRSSGSVCGENANMRLWEKWEDRTTHDPSFQRMPSRKPTMVGEIVLAPVPTFEYLSEVSLSLESSSFCSVVRMMSFSALPNSYRFQNPNRSTNAFSLNMNLLHLSSPLPSSWRQSSEIVFALHPLKR